MYLILCVALAGMIAEVTPPSGEIVRMPFDEEGNYRTDDRALARHLEGIAGYTVVWPEEAKGANPNFQPEGSIVVPPVVSVAPPALSEKQAAVLIAEKNSPAEKSADPKKPASRAKKNEAPAEVVPPVVVTEPVPAVVPPAEKPADGEGDTTEEHTGEAK
jgi:hypothetical protein